MHPLKDSWKSEMCTLYDGKYIRGKNVNTFRYNTEKAGGRKSTGIYEKTNKPLLRHNYIQTYKNILKYDFLHTSSSFLSNAANKVTGCGFIE